MSLDDDFAPVADRSRALRTHFAAAVAEILDAKDDRTDDRLPVTKAFAQQLAEVSWSWTTTALAPDLERFAKHAKRLKIASEASAAEERRAKRVRIAIEPQIVWRSLGGGCSSDTVLRHQG